MPPHIGTKLFCRSHIVGTRLSLPVHSFLPTKYWFEAFNIDVYLVNRMPVWSSVSCCSRLCQPKSFWMCLLPMALALPTIKLEFKPIKCIFLGYNLDHKGYLWLDPSTGRVYISRHVVFTEQEFPLSMTKPVPFSKSIIDPMAIFGSFHLWERDQYATWCHIYFYIGPDRLYFHQRPSFQMCTQSPGQASLSSSIA